MKTKRLVLCALFTSLTAIGAFISLPFKPVPISLQSFFVILSGLFLSPSEAFLSQVAYLILGLAGLPIFANFHGGINYIFAPSFGFLLSFPIASFVISSICKKSKSKSRTILSILVGNFVIYGMGLPYLYLIKNFYLASPINAYNILYLVFLPCLPGDCIKAIVAYISTRKLNNL